MKAAPWFCVLVFLSFTAGRIAALDADSAHVTPFELPSARASALGGNHAALVDDFYNAFNNPAGFGAIEKKISVSELSFNVISMEVLNQLNTDEMSVNMMRSLLKDRIDAGLVSGGPVSFGSINNGVGWRVFNATRIDIHWERDDVFVLNPIFSEELALNLGYGKRLASSGDATFDAGFLVKGFYRLAYTPEDVYVQTIKYIFAEMKNEPFEAQIGGGFDAGVRWTWRNSFSAGLAWKDIYSPAYVTRYRNLEKYNDQIMYEQSVKTVNSRLGVGIVWRLPSPEMHRYNTDLIFAADYNGLLDIQTRNRSQLLYYSAGLELRFLEVISLRGGFADCLPAGGIGFNFSIFQLDLTYGGKELGSEPNEKPTWFVDIGLLFRY